MSVRRKLQLIHDVRYQSAALTKGAKRCGDRSVGGLETCRLLILPQGRTSVTLLLQYHPEPPACACMARLPGCNGRLQIPAQHFFATLETLSRQRGSASDLIHRIEIVARQAHREVVVVECSSPLFLFLQRASQT